VLLTLHTFRGQGSAAWPSHATLAERARCCTRTVQRALQHAQHLGLVSWAERRVRAGWRWLRTSNLDRFAAGGDARFKVGTVHLDQGSQRATTGFHYRTLWPRRGEVAEEGRVRTRKRLSTNCCGRQRRLQTYSSGAGW
jgi:Helix-turn-helix domain